jgi:hypothetical protein
MRRLSALALLRWTSRTFGDDAATRVFEPLVADWQRERRGAPTVSRRVMRDLSGMAALVTTAAHMATRLAMPWHLPRRDVDAIGRTLISYAATGLALGLAPFVLVPIVSGPLRLAFLASMAPAVLAVSLAVALLPTAAAIARRSRGGWPTRAPWLLTLVTALSMAALVAHLGWVVPAVNRQYQEHAVSGGAGRVIGLSRDVKALTLAELVAGHPPAGVHPRVTGPARRHEAWLRLALATAWPATFAWFGWRLARYRRSLGVAAVAGWWTLAFITTLLVSFGGLGGVIVSAGTWTVAAAMLRHETAASLLDDMTTPATAHGSARR